MTTPNCSEEIQASDDPKASPSGPSETPTGSPGLDLPDGVGVWERESEWYMVGKKEGMWDGFARRLFLDDFGVGVSCIKRIRDLPRGGWSRAISEREAGERTREWQTATGCVDPTTIATSLARIRQSLHCGPTEGIPDGIERLKRELREAQKAESGWRDECQAVRTERDDLRHWKRTESLVALGQYWRWAGDEYDHPESLVCPIIVQPDKMREIQSQLATNQANIGKLEETVSKLESERNELRQGVELLNERSVVAAKQIEDRDAQIRKLTEELDRLRRLILDFDTWDKDHSRKDDQPLAAIEAEAESLRAAAAPGEHSEDETTGERGQSPTKRRASYLSVPQQFALQHACRILTAAFGANTYQVGSSLTRSDYRDVDLRCILDDEEYDALLGGLSCNQYRLDLLNAALSEWLQARTGLPIDFQFQRRTEANRDFDGARNFMGMPIRGSSPTNTPEDANGCI